VVFLVVWQSAAASGLWNETSLQEDIRTVSHETGRTSVIVTHSADEAVFLGSRIVVLTARPGRVELDLTIDLPRSGVDPDELRGSAECRTQLRTLAAAQSRRRVSSSSPSRATSRR
jgi:taurine transport system ATP-binding protein